MENVLICLNFEAEFNSKSSSCDGKDNMSGVLDFGRYYEEKSSMGSEKLLQRVEMMLRSYFSSLNQISEC